MAFLVSGKQQVRTPQQMAKAAMKQLALKQLAEDKLPSEAEIIVKYNGQTWHGKATPTVNIDKGEILFHYGATGSNRVDFGIRAVVDGKTQPVLCGLNGNMMTSLGIDPEQRDAIRAKYNLSAPVEDVVEDLDIGERTD